MKIGRKRQENLDNGITVIEEATGEIRTKPLASVGMALSYAQTLAVLSGIPRVFIVRWYETDMYRVSRDEHGVIHTSRLK